MCNTIVAYYRVSTKRQAEKGYSLETQKTRIKAYAKEHNKQIIDEYTEVASGLKGNQPKLIQALTKADETNSTLVVEYLDRLTRSPKIVKLLSNYDVEIISLNEDMEREFALKISEMVFEHLKLPQIVPKRKRIRL